VGEDPDGAGAFAGDGGDLGDVEAGDDAEEDDLGLVGGEGGEQGDGGPGGDGVEGGLGGVVEGGEVGQGLQGDEFVVAAGAAAPAVDGAVTGDGEDPGPEGALVTGHGGVERRREGGADHGAITLTVPAGYCQPGRFRPVGASRPLRVRSSAARRATVLAGAREGAMLTGTVLVADDDADIVRFVEVNLRLEGFQVVTARDGQEALTKALELEPDVVLLDVLMPRIDGYTVCARLRADQRGAAIPVILLTANFISADQEVARRAGANDLVVKPFDPYELMARVKALIRARR
jgi:CheY-like chemotaxis protein